MKIVHLPNFFLPHVTGGKEVYVYNLAQNLKQLGIENKVVIHESECIPSGNYRHNEIAVEVLPPYVDENPFINRFGREVSQATGFREFLLKEEPDIVHFHDQNGGASLTHMKIAHDLHIKTIITFHTPGQVCPQRSLFLNGKSVCDGELLIKRCTACQINDLGINTLVAESVKSIPSRNIRKDPITKIGKLLSYSSLTKRFIDSYYHFFNSANAIHTYANWTIDMFVKNGVDDKKLHFFRTGGVPSLSFKRNLVFKDKLKLCFIGRCNQVKGIHTLIEAVKALPKEYPVEVYFFGPYWDSRYGRKMKSLIESDKRFHLPEMVQNEKIHDRLKDMHVCVIPSIWLETGPITVFDAFSVGLPVIGSRLGGIAELVRDRIDGLLFEPGNTKDLADKIKQLVTDKTLYFKLRKNIQPNRTMKDVANDTLLLYNKILK